MVVNSNGMYYGAVSTSAFAGDDLFLTTESVRLTCCFNDPFPFIRSRLRGRGWGVGSCRLAALLDLVQYRSSTNF